MKIIAAVVIALAPAVAQGEVVSSSDHGFVIRNSVDVAMAPAAAYQRFARPAAWWSPSHTYSGDASNLSMELKPGGCFCEKLAGGGVEHLRVSHANAGKRLILTGGLGPLLFEAVGGTMDVRFAPAGTGTRVTLEYKVSGFPTGGADKLAPAVDGMLAEQLSRYAAGAK